MRGDCLLGGRSCGRAAPRRALLADSQPQSPSSGEDFAIFSFGNCIRGPALGSVSSAAEEEYAPHSSDLTAVRFATLWRVDVRNAPLASTSLPKGTVEVP